MVQYDQLADRWVMSQFSLRPGNYLQCVAVSKTSDATGEWHRYAFQYERFPGLSEAGGMARRLPT